MTEPTDQHREQAREIVRAWLLTSNPLHLVNHKESLIDRITAALSSRDTEIREVLEGLVTCVVDEGGGPRMHWCPLGEDSDMECGPSCDAARDLYAKLQPLPSENPGDTVQK